MEIVNSTFTANLTNCTIPIALDNLPNPPFKPFRRFDGRVLNRFHGATFLIFRSSSIVIIGARTQSIADVAVQHLEACLKDHLKEQNLSIANLTSRNLVGAFRLQPAPPVFTEVVRSWQDLGGKVIYEPELFVNAKFTIGSVTLLLYPAGNIILTGAKDIKDLDTAAQSFISFLKLIIYPPSILPELKAVPPTKMENHKRPQLLKQPPRPAILRKKREFDPPLPSLTPLQQHPQNQPHLAHPPEPTLTEITMTEFPELAPSLDLFHGNTDFDMLIQSQQRPPLPTLAPPPPPPPQAPPSSPQPPPPLPTSNTAGEQDATKDKEGDGPSLPSKEPPKKRQRANKGRCVVPSQQPGTIASNNSSNTGGTEVLQEAIDGVRDCHLSPQCLLLCLPCKIMLIAKINAGEAWRACSNCETINKEMLKCTFH